MLNFYINIVSKLISKNILSNLHNTIILTEFIHVKKTEFIIIQKFEQSHIIKVRFN